MKQNTKQPKERIFRKDIAEGHINGEDQNTDMFYVAVANNIIAAINPEARKYEQLTPSMKKAIAVTLASYLEDLVSESGVWQAFLKIYRRNYERQFPFYNIDGDADYSDDEPCRQAIMFLTWYAIYRSNAEELLNPGFLFLSHVADVVLPILKEAFDSAPETNGRPEMETNNLPPYMNAREMCLWLFSNCYLTKVSNPSELIEEYLDQMDNMLNENISAAQAVYGAFTFLSVNTNLGPVAIPATQWLKEIIAFNPSPYEETQLDALSSFSADGYNAFMVEDVNDSQAEVVDVKGNKAILSAEGFIDGLFNPDLIGKSGFASTITYNGKLNINGLSMVSLPEKFYVDFKTQVESSQETNKKKFDCYLEAFDGKRLTAWQNKKEFDAAVKPVFKKYNIMDNFEELELDDDANIGFVAYLHDNGFLEYGHYDDLLDIPGNKNYYPNPYELAAVLLSGEITEKFTKFLVDDFGVKALLPNDNCAPGFEDVFNQNIHFLTNLKCTDFFKLFSEKVE